MADEDGAKKVKAVVSIVIILIAAFLIVKQLRPQRYTHMQTLVDVEAGKVYQQKMVSGKRVEFPVQSPYSKGKNAYPAYECRECGAIFAYVPPPPPTSAEEMRTRGIPEVGYRCPFDGSYNVTTPQIPEGEEFIPIEEEIPIVGE